VKLYDSLRAPNPRRVRWFLAEKGAEDQVEIIDVSIFNGEHRKADYVGKAGLANVPMVEMDDGTAITESVAICR
jgi:glutathione S-transferase